MPSPLTEDNDLTRKPFEGGTHQRKPKNLKRNRAVSMYAVPVKITTLPIEEFPQEKLHKPSGNYSARSSSDKLLLSKSGVSGKRRKHDLAKDSEEGSHDANGTKRNRTHRPVGKTKPSSSNSLFQRAKGAWMSPVQSSPLQEGISDDLGDQKSKKIPKTKRKRSSHSKNFSDDFEDALDGLKDDVVPMEGEPEDDVESWVEPRRPRISSRVSEHVFVQEGGSFHPRPLSEHQWSAPSGVVEKPKQPHEISLTAIDIALKTQVMFNFLASLLQGALAGFLILFMVFGHHFSTQDIEIFFEDFAFFIHPIGSYIQFSLIIVCVAVYDRADLYNLWKMDCSFMLSKQLLPLLVVMLYSFALLFTVIMSPTENTFKTYLHNATIYANQTEEVSELINYWNGYNFTRGICCVLAWLCNVNVIQGAFFTYLEYLKGNPWELQPSAAWEFEDTNKKILRGTEVRSQSTVVAKNSIQTIHS